ncbi:MAG: DUF3987 domain-containing protein, partial [Lautropia sp.]
GRFHAYLRTDDCPLEKFTLLQKALAQKFNGDHGVNDPSRVMRLPGFWHRKAEPFMTRILSSTNEQPYQIDELIERLGLDLSEPRREEKQRDYRGDDWIADMQSGSDLHQNALRVIGRMVAKGLDEQTIRGVFAALRQQLEEARGEDRVAALYGTEFDRMIRGAFRKFAPEEWPAPLPIKSDLPPAPEFDAKTLLPRVLADYVLDEADRMPCAPDFIAVSLIVAIGAVLGSRCAVKPKRNDDWLSTPNLFGAVVGDPASKKSPALEKGLRFINRLEADANTALASRMIEYEADVAAHKARETAIQAAMKKAAGGKRGEDDLAMNAAMEALKLLSSPAEPHPRRYRTNDSTVEKLGDLLAHSPEGILVFRDELMGLLSSWDREGREGDRTFYLEGWNGAGSYSIDRIGRGSQYIKSLNLSVLGGIQPELLGKYLTTLVGSLDNDGRIQRFQMLVYPDPVAWRWVDRYPVKGTREAVRDIFLRLASFDPVQDGATPADEFVKIPCFLFDDAAMEVFIEWSAELHGTWIALESNPLLAQHFGKFEKLFCAVALILHLAEGRIGPIQADSALRAGAWSEHLAGHARRIYGLLEVAQITTAQGLSRKLAKLPNPFTVREVARKCWSGLATTAQVESALAVLEAFHHVKAIVDDDDGPGRPTTRYSINPAILMTR